MNITLRHGKQPDDFIAWCVAHKTRVDKINILVKETPKDFDLQEKEIVRVYNDPPIEIVNSSISTLLDNFRTIVQTFPAEGQFDNIQTFRQMNTVMTDYINKKNA